MWDSLKKSYRHLKNILGFVTDKRNYENIKKLLKNYKILSDISNIIVSVLVFLSGISFNNFQGFILVYFIR
ncbi:hypothetical protein [Clostridium perfringens str. 13]|uniref:Uncharacterized protein n=1 Tax=Clostridium perfringens (strain 13 / Type A) TaxID=195102 RepID=Q8XK09_CLOPE|nr:hypothetical protein [Clostridium perfringens]BAB81300.1 hypothetical protein [Clostridium perfringens str. 13]